MCSNSKLFEVYSYLKTKYSDLGVLYNKPISYLCTLIGPSTQQDIVFVYKLQQTSPAGSSTLIPLRKCPEVSQDHNLTGSPLKDTCMIETFDLSLETFSKLPWQDHEESYGGIDLNQTRNLLSDCDLQTLGIGCKGSVWVLCQASDNEKVILLALHFGEGRNNRSRVSFEGLQAPSKLDIAEMLKIHNSSIHGSPKTETFVESLFQIKPNLSLQLNSSSSEITCLNSYRNHEALLKQTINVKEPGSTTNNFWLYLDVLSAMKESIVEYKESEGLSEPIYNCGRGIEIDDLFEQINSCMAELPSFYDADKSARSCHIEDVIGRIKLREPVDVTDKLWEILRRCSCYKDLQQAFGFVFRCAATCNILNIPKNKNRVAEIIREVQQQRLAIPSLTGSEPLELLLEIGIENLVKNYESIFIESKICGLKDLREYLLFKDEHNSYTYGKKSFYDGNSADNQRKTLLSKSLTDEKYPQHSAVGFQNSNFNQKEVEYTLGRLVQIQLVLEHLLLNQANLNLKSVNYQIFKELMDRNPRPLDEVISTIYDEVQIPISPGEILPDLENRYPDQRKIVMNSKTQFKAIQSTFYYNTEYIFPPNCFNFTADSSNKENVYYSWRVLKITT